MIGSLVSLMIIKFFIMDRYIEQLIGDIKESTMRLPPRPEFDLPEEMEVLRGVIEWENAESKPMQEWFGISQDNFPDESKLNNKQIDLLVKEILDLWKAYNFYPDFPKGLPNRIAYKILVNYLTEPVAWISEGESYIEFCNYEPSDCPFPIEFCRCKVSEDLDKEVDQLLSVNDKNIARLTVFLKNVEFYQNCKNYW